jgi:phospholipase C
MRLAAKILLVVAATTTIAANAQDPTNPQGEVQHVIVVIQENCTVDNLFGSNFAARVGFHGLVTLGLSRER